MGHPHQYQLHLWLWKGESEATCSQHPYLGSPGGNHCLALAWQMLHVQGNSSLSLSVVDIDLKQSVFRVCLAARADYYSVAVVAIVLPQGTF